MKDFPKKEHLAAFMEKMWGVNPVPYNPLFTWMAGDAYAGIYMSYIFRMFHSGKGKKSLNFSDCGNNSETGLTKAQLNKAVKMWRELGILKVQRIGETTKHHYEMNYEKFFRLAADCLEDKQAEILDNLARDWHKMEKKAK